MDVAELLGRVKSAAGLFEAYEVRTVTGYRNAKDGGVQEVTIQILDAGPDFGGHRHQVIATDEQGRSAAGNPMDSIGDALAVVHWSNLDAPIRKSGATS